MKDQIVEEALAVAKKPYSKPVLVALDFDQTETGGLTNGDGDDVS